MTPSSRAVCFLPLYNPQYIINMLFYKLTTRYKKRLADTISPVSLYLKLRDHYANTFMLESSDYHGHDNSFSYICFDPVARFELFQGHAQMTFPDGAKVDMKLDQEVNASFMLREFIHSFRVDTLDLPFMYNGLFGYHSYDAVRYYEEINIRTYEEEDQKIPEMLYQIFRYVVVIDHFKNEMYLFEHSFLKEGEQASDADASLAKVEQLILNRNVPEFPFETVGEQTSNFTDQAFLEILQKGKDHCQLGDVFQIVLSRQYCQPFQGDEFQVYRSLRSVNPSPYLFFADYGDFKLFGSSPEAQLIIKEGEATIHPIAGTFRRTGNDVEDRILAEKLAADPKETSEHVMLVDLARNDLSRNGSGVKVDTFKEIQFYSHVIHLVSKVTAQIADDVFALKLVADTFPAGTLSGAPKHKAMQLINRYENQNRGFYGGCIGVIGFDESFNHAIIIRSFLSKNNKLYFQAGAGVVAKSVPESELQEVENKLAALRAAIAHAQKHQKDLAFQPA